MIQRLNYIALLIVAPTPVRRSVIGSQETEPDVAACGRGVLSHRRPAWQISLQTAGRTGPSSGLAQGQESRWQKQNILVPSRLQYVMLRRTIRGNVLPAPALPVFSKERGA